MNVHIVVDHSVFNIEHPLVFSFIVVVFWLQTEMDSNKQELF